MLAQTRAQELTEQIRNHAKGINDALVEMRDDELYKHMGYGTMEQWARGEFEWTGRHLRYQIAHARTEQVLLQSGTMVPPKSERQTRPLAGLEAEEKVQAWELAIEKAADKDISYKHVEAAVKEIKPPPLPTTPPIPEGKYSVIYADPPWPVGSMVLDKWESPIDDKYPTMSIDEIAELPVADIAAEECSLFLWTTHTFLQDALEIMEKWGFKYFCCITWHKHGGWTQNGFHKSTEFLLFGYQGRMNVIQHGGAIPTLISEKKGKHSKKPDSIRHIIEAKTPKPRIELFARESHDGWVVWGDEV